MNCGSVSGSWRSSCSLGHLQILREFFAMRFPERPYKGLRNQGATCYLNSVLQCFYMTEVFRREVENFTGDSTNTDNESAALIEELQKLFKMLKQHNGTTEKITQCLGINNVNEQQDVVEYYQLILYMITPQMSKIFMGELKTTIKCLSDHEQEKKTTMFCIPLPINYNYGEVFSVVMGIDNFLKEDKLSEDNLIYCDLCKQKAQATIRTEIVKFPTILTLNLRRFSFRGHHMTLVKNHCPVKISLHLEFKNHTKYELYAIINHIGEKNGGHYNAVIKSSADNAWYCFDDSSVTKEHKFKESLQNSQLAYLLMYRKMDDSPPDTNPTNFTNDSTKQSDQTRKPCPGYHNTELNWGQHDHYEQLKSPTSVMKVDTQSAVCSDAPKSPDAAIKGNDISKASGWNVPLPDSPLHQMEDLDRFKNIPIELNDAIVKGIPRNVIETLIQLQNRVTSLEKENSVLRDRCEKLDAQKRRWNLQVTGIKENQGEDIRKILIDLFGKVSPEIGEELSYSIDTGYRVGPHSEGAYPSRRIIVHFLSRNIRDKIWKDAKTSTFLKETKVGIFEDFTKRTRDARKKLWPIVKQARKEGKKASLRGQYAFIDGRSISAKDQLV